MYFQFYLLFSILDFNVLCSILVILSISIVGITITNLRFDLIVPKIELNSIPCYDKK